MEIITMRSVLLLICAGLLGAGALLAVGTIEPGRLAAAPATVPADKAALGKNIREYLLANPEARFTNLGARSVKPCPRLADDSPGQQPVVRLGRGIPAILTWAKTA